LQEKADVRQLACDCRRRARAHDARFARNCAGQLLSVNPGELWFKRNVARKSYCVFAGCAVVGVAFIIYAVIARAGWIAFPVGGLWLLVAVPWFTAARESRRREQFGFDPDEQDVLTLVRQGRKIEAIKRYREQHPGISLREAKHVVDGL
jgi:hypothetical protein